MKDIKIDHLNDLKEKFYNEKGNVILKNALSKTNLLDCINNQERLSNNIFTFETEIKTLPVCNQLASGRCWIFAGLNILREIACKNLNLAEFELSQNYIAFYDKLEKVNYCLESIIELKDLNPTDRTFDYVLKNSLGDGGQWDMFVNLVKKYGVVPKSVMVETFQSSNTKESSYVLNTLVKKFASDIKKINDLDKIRELKDNLMDKVYNFLVMCFGMPKNVFDFEYKDKDGNYHLEKRITPIEFYEKYINLNLDDYISIINSPTKDKPFNKTYTVKYLGNVYGKNVRYLNLEMERLISLCKAQLNSGELVWFGSDCSKFGDRFKGIWDDLLFDYSCFNIDLEMSKEDKLDFGQSVMNHAMVISGYSCDKWKIENSWGKDRGDKGYFIMSDTWFNNYVYQAVINKKYLSKDELKALNELNDIELDPWDPMGTLAKAK